MARIPDAATVAERWAQGLANAQTKMQQGVESVTQSPGDAAIRAGQAYIQRVTEAYNTGRWQRGLQRSGLEGWRQPMLQVGVQRAVQGAAESKGKFMERIQPVLQFEAQLQAQVRAMPNVTDLDREARAIAWIRGMRQFGANH